VARPSRLEVVTHRLPSGATTTVRSRPYLPTKKSVGPWSFRAEAQKIADSLDGRGHKQLYWVELIGQNGGGSRN